MDYIYKDDNGATWDEFLQEANATDPDLVGKDEEGNYYPKFSHTPVVKNNGFLVNIRDGGAIDFPGIDSIKRLGTYEEIFSDQVLSDEYCEVYDYITPVQYVDDEGNLQSYLRAPKFCVFCGDPAMGASITAAVATRRGV